MDWPRLQQTAIGAFAAGLGIAAAIVVIAAILVGFANILTFVADRT